jgi:hypothetical protein
MATWKKVIVSGSVAELSASLYRGPGQSPQQITNLASTTILSGSFSGSFYGSFNGASLGGNTLEAATYDGDWGGGYFQTGSAGDGIWEIGVTTYSTAIDDINELLGTFVSVSDVNPLQTGTYTHTATATQTATSKILSFGTNLTDGNNNSYYPAKRATDASTYAQGGSDLNLNGTFTTNGAGTGDITTSATKTGTIYHIANNHSVVFTLKGTAGSFTNGTQTGNNPVRYFHEGVLEVYVNDASTPKIAVSLSGSTAAINTTLNNVTVVAGAVGNVYQSLLGQTQTTEAAGNTHKYRAGASVTVANAAFRDGWNWIAIVHNTQPGDAAGSDRTLKLYEFIKHSDSSTLINDGTTHVTAGVDAYNNFAITQGDSAFHYLSGVKYFSNTATISPLTSSILVSNSYKMVHPSISTTLGTPLISTGERFVATGSKISAADSINTTNTTANSTAAASIPILNATATTPFDSTLSASIYESFDITDYSDFFGWKDANDITGATITVTNNFKSPTSVTSAAFSTGSFYFKKGTVAGNTSQREYFNDETRRLPSNVDVTSAPVIAALKTTSAIGNTYGWNSETSLVSATAGYSDGLLCQPNNFVTGDGLSTGKLVYPSKGARNSDGNFTTVDLGPTSNVNYSAASGERYFYRNFYLNSSNSVTGIGFTAKGSATIVLSDATFTSNSNQIKVDFKIPGYYTAWIPMFDDADYSLSPGQLSRIAPNSSAALSTITVDTNGLNYTFASTSRKNILNRFDALGGAASVTAAAANAISIVVRITVPAGWTGNLTYLSTSALTGTVDTSGYDTTNANITWS